MPPGGRRARLATGRLVSPPACKRAETPLTLRKEKPYDGWPPWTGGDADEILATEILSGTHPTVARRGDKGTRRESYIARRPRQEMAGTQRRYIDSGPRRARLGYPSAPRGPARGASPETAARICIREKLLFIYKWCRRDCGGAVRASEASRKRLRRRLLPACGSARERTRASEEGVV
eukprot:3370658-Pyramimonas_sp.AAC.1